MSPYASGRDGILLDPREPHLARQQPGDYLEGLEQSVCGALNKAAEGDPMLAALDLVRVYLAHAPLPVRDAAEVPPTYAEFRETLELLDRRANAFGKQSLDLIVELRKVAERGAGKRELSVAALLLIAGLATIAGFYLGRLSL